MRRRGGFDRPAYVMFSSGTTGAPKCIVQGPGVALTHAKEAALHWDLRPGDASLWYTTTGWMMWNWLLGVSLSTGAGPALFVRVLLSTPVEEAPPPVGASGLRRLGRALRRRRDLLREDGPPPAHRRSLGRRR